MNVVDRRSVLRGLAGGVVVAGVGGALLMRSAEALPSADLQSARPAGRAAHADSRKYAQFQRPVTGPEPIRPSPRPPPRRRRRRGVCWWHRGRRECGWRWR
jgi:hypothetical protein